jgi:hypothetical protein
MSVFVNNCGEIAARFNTHVHTIHHTPRGDDSHGSGSNAVDAATDVMIRVSRVGDTTRSTATVDRMKDGPDKADGAGFGFELVPRQVGVDRHGNPMMSCSVEITEDKEAVKAARSTEKKISETKAIKTFRDAFNEALDDFGEVIQVRGDGPKVKAVDVKRVREQFEVRYVTGETDEKKRVAAASKAFRRTIAGLPPQFATKTRDGRELIWKAT